MNGSRDFPRSLPPLRMSVAFIVRQEIASGGFNVPADPRHLFSVDGPELFSVPARGRIELLPLFRRQSSQQMIDNNCTGFSARKGGSILQSQSFFLFHG